MLGISTIRNLLDTKPQNCIMTWWRDVLSAASLLCILFIGGMTHAAEMPPQWPWHGVNIDNLADGALEKLEQIATHLPINSVRLQLKPRKLARRRGISVKAAWGESLRWADQALDKCRQLKLVCIVDLSEFPVNRETEYNQKSPRFWENPADLAGVVATAEAMARRWRGRGPELGGYDIMSEPGMWKGKHAGLPPQWRKLQKKIVSAIRMWDKVHWVIVKPGPWGVPSGYRNFKPLNDAKLIYSVHVYTPHAFTHQGLRGLKFGLKYPGMIDHRFWDKHALREALAPVRSFQKHYGVLIWVGEFSAIRWAPGGEQYIRDLVPIFNEYGWGWAYFSFGWYHGWNPDFDSSRLNGTPEKWRHHFVGMKSRRWKTLKIIFANPTPAGTLTK